MAERSWVRSRPCFLWKFAVYTMWFILCLGVPVYSAHVTSGWLKGHSGIYVEVKHFESLGNGKEATYTINYRCEICGHSLDLRRRWVKKDCTGGPIYYFVGRDKTLEEVMEHLAKSEIPNVKEFGQAEKDGEGWSTDKPKIKQATFKSPRLAIEELKKLKEIHANDSELCKTMRAKLNTLRDGWKYAEKYKFYYYGEDSAQNVLKRAREGGGVWFRIRLSFEDKERKWKAEETASIAEGRCSDHSAAPANTPEKYDAKTKCCKCGNPWNGGFRWSWRKPCKYNRADIMYSETNYYKQLANAIGRRNAAKRRERFKNTEPMTTVTCDRRGCDIEDKEEKNKGFYEGPGSTLFHCRAHMQCIKLYCLHHLRKTAERDKVTKMWVDGSQPCEHILQMKSTRGRTATPHARPSKRKKKEDQEADDLLQQISGRRQVEEKDANQPSPISESPPANAASSTTGSKPPAGSADTHSDKSPPAVVSTPTNSDASVSSRRRLLTRLAEAENRAMRDLRNRDAGHVVKEPD